MYTFNAHNRLANKYVIYKLRLASERSQPLFVQPTKTDFEKVKMHELQDNTVSNIENEDDNICLLFDPACSQRWSALR